MVDKSGGDEMYIQRISGMMRVGVCSGYDPENVYDR